MSAQLTETAVKSRPNRAPPGLPRWHLSSTNAQSGQLPSTHRTVYGSEGWGFESLRARCVDLVRNVTIASVTATV
jgi:hypothetical protein